MRSVIDRGIRLEPPTPRRASVDRPRLLDRLRDRFTTPVTVVVATAGFGKTTLLSQAVAANRPTPLGVDIWLTCSAEDVAGSSLADGLCRALGIATPGTAEQATDAVLDPTWHRSPSEVVLLLDDIHEIPTGSPGAEVLARLVAGLPRNGHLVLCGRQLPPIALSRLDVQGQVVRLDDADLLFTNDELTKVRSSAACVTRSGRGMHWLAGAGRTCRQCGPEGRGRLPPGRDAGGHRT